MDGNRFDDLARAFVAQPTRRGLLRRLVGAAAGLAAAGVATVPTAAAACRPAGTTCREHANCCTGICGPKDRTGRQRCACPAGTRNCGGACCPNEVACNPRGGCCAGVGNAPGGSACREDSECCSGACNEYGGGCLDTCIPSGGTFPHTSLRNLCCTEIGYFDGTTRFCADCVPNGFRPLGEYPSPEARAATCCSGSSDSNGTCIPAP